MEVSTGLERKSSTPMHEVNPIEIARVLKDWKFSDKGSSVYVAGEWIFQLSNTVEQIELRILEKENPDIDKQSHFEIDFNIFDPKDFRMEVIRGIRVDRVICDADKIRFSLGDTAEKEYIRVGVGNDGSFGFSIGGKELGDFSFKRDPKIDPMRKSLERIHERIKRKSDG